MSKSNSLWEEVYEEREKRGNYEAKWLLCVCLLGVTEDMLENYQ